MADDETQGLDELIYLSKSCNNSKMCAEDACQSPAVLAFLQLEREKVITRLRRIEELLGRRRVRSETIDIAPEISQPLYTEEGFGLRRVPNYFSFERRQRPPLKGMVIPSVKKPYFGLKSKWTKQTVREACKKQLPKLRAPKGGHLCQPLCDGCLHSYIVLYLGLESDKQHNDDPNWKPSGYPSIWSADLCDKLRHSLPRGRCASCAQRIPPPVEAKVASRLPQSTSGKPHSIHEVTVPRVTRKAKGRPVGGLRGTQMIPKQKMPIVVDAPDLSFLNASMSNISESNMRDKVDPIDVVERINGMGSTPAAQDDSNANTSENQLHIANCVIKSMSIDSALFKSAHLQQMTLDKVNKAVDGDYSEEKRCVEELYGTCCRQQRPTYCLQTPEDFSTPCRDMGCVMDYKEASESVQDGNLRLSNPKENGRNSSEPRRRQWSSLRRPPFHRGVDDMVRAEHGTEAHNDAVGNASLNNRQTESRVRPILLPRKKAEPVANVEDFKGDEDLEIDLRIVIDSEENVSLEVENVRYRPSDVATPKKKAKETAKISRRRHRDADSEKTTASELED